MRIVRAKGKSVTVMESVTNAENIMPSQNVRDRFFVKKRKKGPDDSEAKIIGAGS